MIESIEISHYKSLADVRLTLHNINVIVGPNGSGKSNIIDAISFLHDCTVEDIDTAITKRHGIDSIRQWSRTRPYNIILDIKFRNGIEHGRYKLILSSNKGQYRIIEEEGYWSGSDSISATKSSEGEDIIVTSFRRDSSSQIIVISSYSAEKSMPPKIHQSELFLSHLYNRYIFSEYRILRRIAEELSSFSAYSIYPNTLRRPQVVSRERTLLEDGSNLATILKRINSTGTARSRRSKEDLISALRTVFPIASDILVRSAGGFFVPVIRVEEQLGQDVHDFNLSQISDGTLRILGLLTSFYQPFAPNKIAVEEPEQMIHPGALSIIAEAAKDFAEGENQYNKKGSAQVFITTHSPTLLDLFDPNQILWTKFKNGVTECGGISVRQKSLIVDHLFSAGEILLSEGFF